MNNVVQITVGRFLLIYLLLLLVLAIMKHCKIQQSRLLLAGSIRMTLQLVIAGGVLSYLFAAPHPILTVFYVIAMAAFAIHRVISLNTGLNRRFQWCIGLSLAFSGLGVAVFFIAAVVGESLWNPQYAIPLSGMIFGNAMTGVNLGVKTFRESLSSDRERLEVLLNFGAHPRVILRPLVSRALETALLPTMNSMIGMGIVSLPGMMTGQILSGTLPTTAILYQIAIMIAICTVVCLSVFGSLYFGHQTLYNDQHRFLF